MTLLADLEDFVRNHRPHGTLTGDATEPAWNGYLLTVACPCGVVFGRWGHARGCPAGSAPGCVAELSLGASKRSTRAEIPRRPWDSRLPGSESGFLRCLRHNGAEKWAKVVCVAVRALEYPRVMFCDGRMSRH